MHRMTDQPLVVLLMGVSGCGKTTVGRALADALGWDFYDGDAFHPAANIAKMSRGIPLTDADRYPWLAALHTRIATCLTQGQSAVVTCSALKQHYREQLCHANEAVLLVYLRGSYERIAQRLRERQGHFMPPGMLQSQFDTLEEPEQALVVDVEQDVASMVAMIVKAIQRRQGG